MIIEDLTKEDLLNFNVITYDDPFFRIIGYKEKNEIIGYCTFHYLYDRIEILYIYVKEEERGRKIGESMLKYVIDYAKDQKCQNITLEVKKTNEIAINLYKKLGFKEVAIRKKYYDGIDGILMEWVE